MEAKLLERIKEQLVRHEGLRLKPYRCTAGKLTIGIGRNLDLVSTQMTQIERIFADHNSTGFKSDPCLVALLLSYLMSYPRDEELAVILNLKTLGEGIVKTVGLDQSATELLTGSEIDAFKANLELRSLTILKSYLNPAGLDRLNELKPRQPRLIRVGVI